MVYVSDNGQLAGGGELPEGMFVGDVVALVGGFLVFVGILGHDAHQQLVQRVLDAFPIEGRHHDASMLGVSAGKFAVFGLLRMRLSRGMARALSDTTPQAFMRAMYRQGDQHLTSKQLMSHSDSYFDIR